MYSSTTDGFHALNEEDGGEAGTEPMRSSSAQDPSSWDDPDAVWGQSIRKTTKKLIGALRLGNRARARALIVIGPVAAGKRTVAKLLCRACNAALVDPDDAKEFLPEYGGGKGWYAVHVESTHLMAEVLERLIRDNSNFVLMRVGSDVDDIRDMMSDFKLLGYRISLINITIDRDEAFRRMAQRFLDTGKLINPDYCLRIGDLPREAYCTLRDEGIADEAIEIDNNGPPGVFRIIDGEGSQLVKRLRLSP